MASGRPQRPNDPSLISSLEAAVREIRRPGPLELVWNWRWELGFSPPGPGCPRSSRAALASSGSLQPRGPGWRSL